MGVVCCLDDLSSYHFVHGGVLCRERPIHQWELRYHPGPVCHRRPLLLRVCAGVPPPMDRVAGPAVLPPAAVKHHRPDRHRPVLHFAFHAGVWQRRPGRGAPQGHRHRAALPPDPAGLPGLQAHRLRRAARARDQRREGEQGDARHVHHQPPRRDHRVQQHRLPLREERGGHRVHEHPRVVLVGAGDRAHGRLRRHVPADDPREAHGLRPHDHRPHRHRAPRLHHRDELHARLGALQGGAEGPGPGEQAPRAAEAGSPTHGALDGGPLQALPRAEERDDLAEELGRSAEEGKARAAV
mmetsp:Transcript_15392/g.36568  ORF Transcript_15392/g.36568 Transcript_15392/m.36568 type:complete len:297 (+) Transcript_15392:1168-2058(+)